jgi:ABC-2 type transport system permease protein
MDKIWLIIQREYLTRVKKKSFLVMTFLGPLISGGLILGAVFLFSKNEVFQRVLISDPQGWIIESEVLDPQSIGLSRTLFKDTEHLKYDFRKGTVDAANEIKSGAYTIVVEVVGNYDDCTLAMKYAKVPSLTMQKSIEQNIESSLEKYFVHKQGLLWSDYKSIKKDVTFAMVNVEKPEENTMVNLKAGFGFAFAIFIYLFILLYGIQVMRGVIEEKTNRIIEVIISSVKPFQLMMGKVIGIGMVGLTQFVLWVLLTSAISAVGIGSYREKILKDMSVNMEAMQPQSTNGVQAAISEDALEKSLALQAKTEKGNEVLDGILSIPWFDMILSFLFFFIGGYLLYASLFAAIGAAVDSETDTQQFMLPVTIPLIFAYFVSFMMIENPEGNLGTIFALVPFTSPIVMMVKTAIGVSIGLKLLSMAILTVTFIFFTWLAGRIYRVGILMYGKKATYKELWKWIRYSG